MYSYLVLLDRPEKRVWSTKQGRYITKKEQRKELAAERTRASTIDAAVAEKLGWGRGYLLYVDPQLGVNCPDGSWLPYEKLEEMRAEAATAYDKRLGRGKIGTRIAVYSVAALASMYLVSIGPDALKAFMFAAVGVGILFWLMTRRG